MVQYILYSLSMMIKNGKITIIEDSSKSPEKDEFGKCSLDLLLCADCNYRVTNSFYGHYAQRVSILRNRLSRYWSSSECKRYRASSTDAGISSGTLCPYPRS
jgi:hypothetical protein